MKKVLIILFFGIFFCDSFSLSVSAYYIGMSADLVLGQNDFTTTTAGTTQSKLTGPAGIVIDNKGRLIVTELNNNRVLVWNSIPTRNGVSADLVLGQQDFVSGSANRGGSVAANTLSGPQAVYSDGVRLVVADSGNNRVLIWNTFPTANGQDADVVVGNSSMSSATGSCAQDKFAFPTGVAMYGEKLLVSDGNNRRVLIFNSVPTTNGASADVVLGHSVFNSCSLQSASASSLPTAKGLWVDKNGKLFVTDDSDKRVMIWNSIPTQNNQSADVVVGQNDFTSSSAGTTASKLSSSLRGIYSSGSRLFVPDQGNHRVLVFNTIPSDNGASADIVLGQSSFTSGSANQGGSTSASGFNNSGRVFEYNNNLYVSDYSNNRILIFNNVLSTPQLGISTIETLSDGRIRVKGTVELGERGRYSLSSVQASVNGEGYGNVTEMSGGRDNGAGKTLYDFTHEFSPWQNNGTKETWNSRGYVVRFKAITSNAEESTAVLFSPFNFTSVSGDSSKPTFKFTVPVHHWSTLVDSLDSYEIQVKRSNESEYTTYLSSIPVSTSTNPLLNTTHDSSTGTITVSSKDKTLLPGSYTMRIIAKSKSGYSFSSNTISYTSDSKPATFIPSASSFHLSLTSISNLNPQLSSYLKPAKVDFYSKLSSVSTTFKGIAYANSAITLTLIQQNCNPTTNNNTYCTHTYTTTTQPNSTFVILVPNKDLLSNKKYIGFLTATLNKQESSVAPFSFSVN